MRVFWHTALALFLGATLSAPATALTNRQVAEKLNSIPAFAIVTKDGQPLIVPIKNEKETVNVIPVFTDAKVAEQNYAEFKKNAPANIATRYQLIPIPLGEAFESARLEGEKKDSKVRYYFQAGPDALKRALTLAQQIETTLKEFPGIPLFFLGKDGEPVVFSRGSEQLLPFFLSEVDLLKQWEEIKKLKPDVANQASVQVMSIYQVIEFMLDTKNDKSSQSITFVADEQSLKFVDDIRKNLPPEFSSKSTPKATDKPAAPKVQPETKDPANP